MNPCITTLFLEVNRLGLTVFELGRELRSDSVSRCIASAMARSYCVWRSIVDLSGSIHRVSCIASAVIRDLCKLCFPLTGKAITAVSCSVFLTAAVFSLLEDTPI